MTSIHAAASLALIAALTGALAAAPAAAAPAPPPNRLPDLSRVPVPVVDVFEASVARQLTQARAETSSLIARKSQDAIEAFGTLCLLYLRYELFHAAEPCLGEARAASPADFRWPYYQSFTHSRSGDLDQARENVEA